MQSCHVIIIGAGIGGLTAALSLQRHGAKVSIFERATQLGEIGAGLVITPNAMHALAFLGVAEAIAATSILSDALEIRDYRSGSVLLRRPSGNVYVARYGAGHYQVHRADLHNALGSAVLANDPNCIHLGRTFIDLTQDRNGVVARFADGTLAQGEALVGCDGGRSTVRERVFGSAPAGYTGQTSFRALVPAARLPEGLTRLQCFHIGPDRFLVHFALRDRSVVNMVANARQPQWQDDGWVVPAEVDELRDLYGDFHPSLLQIIGLIEPGTLFKWGLRDREPLQHWTKRCVSMLGDAAHPMLPYLGQGAVMAIEDGTVLGRCFATAAAPEEALLLYERARKRRANAAQIYSRERGRALQGSDGEPPNPGRDAEDLGLFDYNPACAPI